MSIAPDEIECLVRGVYGLRGLTLWRPWPSAIFRGGKNIENRPKAPPRSIIGKLIALHSGLTYDTSGAALMRPLGFVPPPDSEARSRVIEGVARVVAGVELDVAIRAREMDARLSDAQLRVLESRWSFGRWCWLLDDVVALEEPVAYAGAQGLWPVHCSAEQDIGVQLMGPMTLSPVASTP